MRNQHPGTCYRCGLPVEAVAGHFEKFRTKHINMWGQKSAGTKWLTQHAECAIKFRGTSTHHLFNPETTK